VTTNVTLHAGHDVRYFTAGQNQGGFAGAMSYYTPAGEPAGEWAGKGAAALGLAGPVGAGVLERLYQQYIGPAGEEGGRFLARAVSVDLDEGPGLVAAQTLSFLCAGIGGPAAAKGRLGDAYAVASGDHRLIGAGRAGHGA
jgi:hypothetical protein